MSARGWEVRGQGAVCLRDDVLQDSHLLPKALYKLVRGEDGGPIISNRHNAWTTDKQVTKHLLCSACELRFHKYGEDWTLQHIYRGQKGFMLLDALSRCTPVAKKPEFSVYALSEMRDVSVHELSYFAVSIFWRSAATNWKIDNHSLPRPTFGPKYMAAFSDYLLGKAGFPSNIALNVEVCDDPTVPAKTLMTPTGSKHVGYHRYQFMVPGVAFHLYVGQKIPVENRSCCVMTGERPALFRRNYEPLISSTVALFSKTARISATLKDEIGKLGLPDR
jgi:hypothetical protein